MLKVFNEVNSLDKKCYKKYLLSEEILMEHAAIGIYNHIIKKFDYNSKILIVCGSGNNGADGIVVARLLNRYYNIELFIIKEPKSPIAILQKKRILSLGIKTINSISETNSYDIVVDCILGTGLNNTLSLDIKNIIDTINNIEAYKIACDIPSGIDQQGKILSTAFKANTTITMGALKISLLTDIAKDYVGDIKVANLGLINSLYEGDTNCYLLEKKDLKLPHRTQKDTNKGLYGHLSVILGDKKGAGLIVCETALNFGVGLVTAITDDTNIPYTIMYSETIPQKTTCIALGMGLGNNFDKEILNTNLPLLLDADIFYNDIILTQLHKNNIVLTPHPKEFCSLLKITNIDNIDIKTLQNNRFYYLNKFCKKYPNVVVVLKGANSIVQQNDKIYINNLGTAKLSFGGSGDILAGIIASLLTQNYTPLDSAIQGTLVHTIASLNYDKNDYSLNVKDLIEQIKIV